MRRTLARLFALGALIAPPALGQTPATARPQQAATEPPKPFAALSESALSLRDSIVALARAQVGKRYVLGGTSPAKGFDCSGLVQYIVAALRVPLPRTAHQQASSGAPIPRDTAQLRPGDLLTFGTGKRISHIGIYVGDGRFIHASTKAGRVIETNLLRSPAPGIKPWKGARRLALGDSVAADSTGG